MNISFVIPYWQRDDKATELPDLKEFKEFLSSYDECRVDFVK